MARYTYDQFRKSAQDSGLLGEFSQADLQMARQNPDFGMSILKYKQDYHNAATDEERALANRNAENLRSSWGSYTGGADGGSFTMDLMSPGHFQYGQAAPTYENPYAGDVSSLWQQQQNYGDFSYQDAPTYQDRYAGDIAGLWQQQQNYGDFSYQDAPTYQNRYDETIQDLIAGILQRPDFSYSPETDPLYQQYRKQYNREGQRAAEDALGAAAAASGGIPSSYAAAAAGQAGNYYAAQLADKIPELYQLAYNQYLNDYDMQLSDLGVVQGAEQSDYDKFLNTLSQYNADRNLAYDQWQTGYDRLSNNLQTALGLQDADFNRYLAALDQYNADRNLAYDQWQTGYDRLSNNLQTALGLQDTGYNQYLAALDQYNTDRNFAYGQFLDELASQEAERNQALENAVLAGEYGDYAYLNGLGVNTDNNPVDWERQQRLEQQNDEREQQRQEREAQAQALAQAQVDAILSAGGTPSAQLLEQSGYAQEYVDALRRYYQNQAG